MAEDPKTTLLVSNLGWNVRGHHVQAHFEKYGKVKDAFIVYVGKRSRGFGFCTFESADAATKALAEDGKNFAAPGSTDEGRDMMVKLAIPLEKPRERKPKEKKKASGEAADTKPKPKPKKDAKAKDAKAKDAIPKPKPKNAKGAGKASEGIGNDVFNVDPAAMTFLGEMREKYGIENRNDVMKKLITHALKKGSKGSMFKEEPAKPAKVHKLRLTLSDDERAMITTTASAHYKDNKFSTHMVIQSLIVNYMPNGAGHKMLDAALGSKA